jgi:hypothetical protein
MPTHSINPKECDDGIRDAVVLLWKAGFRTFTSCEGGRGHSFQHETIGLELEGGYADFHRRLVRFLRSQGMENFTISLVTDYHPDHPEGKRCVYLGGLDILSTTKRRQVLKTSRRREQKAMRQLRELGIDVGDIAK